MRLLTEEELNKAFMGSDYHPASKILWGIKQGVERVADAEHKETLKAVGEWIEKHWNDVLREATVQDKEIEAFKRGEMPEEASTSG